MQVTINAEGKMIFQTNNELEIYAVKKWMEEN